jgi:hypothetical protein
VTAGTGLSGGGSSGAVSLNLDFSELTDKTTDISGTTEFIIQDGSIESRKAASEIKLSNFNNDSGWTSNTGDITGVTAGTGLSGGGSSGSVTINHASHTGDVTGSTALTIAANVVSYEKIDDEFTTSDALTAAATVNVDFDAAQIFTLTPTSSTTLNVTNPKVGITKTVIVTGAGGSYTLAFTVGGASGTFNLIAGEYDDTTAAKNLIQIICVSATEFWYSISQIAS